MNLKGRINKLESRLNVNNSPCFCGKKFIDLIRLAPDAVLTFCRNCKETFDVWENLAREAVAENARNLTNEH